MRKADYDRVLGIAQEIQSRARQRDKVGELDAAIERALPGPERRLLIHLRTIARLDDE
jgi:hypothetical protein